MSCSTGNRTPTHHIRKKLISLSCRNFGLFKAPILYKIFGKIDRREKIFGKSTSNIGLYKQQVFMGSGNYQTLFAD
jgi:hypothetical protein